MILVLASNAIDAAEAPPVLIERQVGQAVVLTFSAHPAGGNANLQGAGSLPVGLSVAPGSDLDDQGGAINAGTAADLVIQCDAAGAYLITIGAHQIALTVAAPADSGRVFTRRVYSDRVYDARVFSERVYGPAMAQ